LNNIRNKPAMLLTELKKNKNLKNSTVKRIIKPI
jgi:predicted transcriptional regulator